MHDLGSNFPNMTGHADGRDEEMPVEECGNMLIMMLALAQSVSDPVDDIVERKQKVLKDSSQSLDENTRVFPLRMAEGEEVASLDEHWHRNERVVAESKHWLSKSYNLLKQWTQYLVDFALEPKNQREIPTFRTVTYSANSFQYQQMILLDDWRCKAILR